MRPVIMVLVVLALMAGVGPALAAPVKIPMPPLRNAELAGVDPITTCEGRIQLTIAYYDTKESVDAPVYKYYVVSFLDDSRPLVITIIDDPNKDPVSYTHYVDYDGDGYADKQTGERVSLCEEATKAIEARKNRKA